MKYSDEIISSILDTQAVDITSIVDVASHARLWGSLVGCLEVPTTGLLGTVIDIILSSVSRHFKLLK